MNADQIRKAQQEVVRSRRQLTETASELQHRLRPGTIATNAWDGVKDRSGELAEDAVEAVKARPVAASAALAAVTLFLARSPLRSAVSWLFSKSPDEDLVTTRLDTHDSNFDLTAPLATRTKDEGVTA